MVGFFIILICIALGIFTGMNLEVPYVYAKYLSVAILACMDSSIDAIIASLNKKFKFSLFLTVFLCNAIITIILVYLGEKLRSRYLSWRNYSIYIKNIKQFK